MLTTITTGEARKKLADLINRVAYGQESIILTRRGEKVAALVSIEALELLRQIEDVIDIEDARKALAKPGKNISANEFWKKLGI